MTVVIKAPAKINLYLKILKKRNDGYHNLLSLFQKISLFDEIMIRSLTGKNRCFIKGEVPEEGNTIIKAVEAFRKVTGIDESVGIQVKKRIPIGAGLGGGSSDAASVLRGLDYLFDTQLDKQVLFKMGLSIGSDVPFFLSANAALVKGRGDRVKPLRPRTDYQVLLVCPDISIMTKEAYSWWDEYCHKNDTGGLFHSLQFINRFRKSMPEKWNFENSFSDVVLPRYPEIDEIIRNFYHVNALYASISGSGSAVFGIFPEKKQLSGIVHNFHKKYHNVFITRPLDRMLEPVLE
jgi:4-diphosphocytidyl-2-C-methyl-D-erythritol kinase